jgi:hypothetical protein
MHREGMQYMQSLLAFWVYARHVPHVTLTPHAARHVVALLILLLLAVGSCFLDSMPDICRV